MKSLQLPLLLEDDLNSLKLLLDKMKEAQTSKLTASVDCSILVENINIKKANRCKIELNNQCSGDDSSTEILFRVISENLWIFSDTQRKQIEETLNIDFNNTTWYKVLNDKCEAFASVHNNIEVDSLDVNDCQGYILFQNIGSAKATCAMSSIFQAFDVSDKQRKETTSIFNETFFILLTLVLVFIVIILFITNRSISEKSQRLKIKLR